MPHQLSGLEGLRLVVGRIPTARFNWCGTKVLKKLCASQWSFYISVS